MALKRLHPDAIVFPPHIYEDSTAERRPELTGADWNALVDRIEQLESKPQDDELEAIYQWANDKHKVVVIFRHACNLSGYGAHFLNYGEQLLPGSWPDAGHGHTERAAIVNAYGIVTLGESSPPISTFEKPPKA